MGIGIICRINKAYREKAEAEAGIQDDEGEGDSGNDSEEEKKEEEEPERPVTTRSRPISSSADTQRPQTTV